MAVIRVSTLEIILCKLLCRLNMCLINDVSVSPLVKNSEFFLVAMGLCLDTMCLQVFIVASNMMLARMFVDYSHITYLYMVADASRLSSIHLPMTRAHFGLVASMPQFPVYL